MKIWYNFLFAFLIFGLFFSPQELVYGRSAQSGFYLKSSVGFAFYDKALQLEASPTFGLGTGIEIANDFSLGLSFFYCPSKQLVEQADSAIAAKYRVYKYALQANFSPKKLLLGPLQFYIGLHLQGMLIDSLPVALTIGALGSVRTESPLSHYIGGGLQAGSVFRLSRILRGKIEINHNQLRATSGQAGRWFGNSALLTGLELLF